MSIPDNVFLDTQHIVQLFQSRTLHLGLHRQEFVELIGFMVDAISYHDIAPVQIQERITNLRVDYAGNFSAQNLDILEFALRELAMQLYQHFKRIGIYTYDSCSSPYHLKDVTFDGSIILQFDYSDPDTIW